jgi:hypothetical protein
MVKEEKIELGTYNFIQIWIFRILLSIAAYFTILNLNQNVFGLSIILLIILFFLIFLHTETIKIITYEVEFTRKYFFDLITSRKEFQKIDIDFIKIERNRTFRSDAFFDLLRINYEPYNRVFIHLKNGSVKKINTHIYLKRLEKLKDFSPLRGNKEG